MSVVSKEEIIKSLTEYFGEETPDEAITLMENITDTFDDMEAKTKDTEDWKQKYEENDKAWRQKYKERFLNNAPKEDENEYEENDVHDEPEVKTFEDLFKERED